MMSGLSGETLVDLDQFDVERGCTINIGGAGNPLDIGVLQFNHFGSGSVYYKHNDIGAPPTHESILIDSDNLVNAFNLDGAALDSLQIIKGAVVISGTMGAITHLLVGSRDNPVNDASLVVNAGAGAITKIVQAGGRVTMNSSSGIASGGSYVISSGVCYFNSGDVRSLIISGGTFYLNTTTTLDHVFIVNGTLDLTKSAGNKTITTAHEIPPGRIIYTPGIHFITNHKKYNKR
jgi:hypothetical protein